jgi:dUTP pyrophosphatase
MVRMSIDFVKKHPDAVLPKRNHDNPSTGDVGYDVFAVEDTVIPARGSAVVEVGLQLANITPGYWFRIEARSGLGFKHSIKPHFGVIDNPYRGDLGIKLYNDSDADVKIEKGKACAQFIVYEMITAYCRFVEEPTTTDRGAKGFGSSDGN